MQVKYIPRKQDLREGKQCRPVRLTILFFRRSRSVSLCLMKCQPAPSIQEG